MEGFIPYKERKIEKGQLVALHWNSHRDVYSIVSMKSRKTHGVVLGYCKKATLLNAYTKIDKSKQESVRRTNVKDRHAYIVGNVENFNSETLAHRIYYSPKYVDDFVDAECYFEKKETVYIERVARVNLDHNGEKPVVTYEK